MMLSLLWDPEIIWLVVSWRLESDLLHLPLRVLLPCHPRRPILLQPALQDQEGKPSSLLLLTLLLPGGFWVNISIRAAGFNILKFLFPYLVEQLIFRHFKK